MMKSLLYLIGGLTLLPSVSLGQTFQYNPNITMPFFQGSIDRGYLKYHFLNNHPTKYLTSVVLSCYNMRSGIVEDYPIVFREYSTDRGIPPRNGRTVKYYLYDQPTSGQCKLTDVKFN